MSTVKKYYEDPELEVISLLETDVIMASGTEEEIQEGEFGDWD